MRDLERDREILKELLPGGDRLTAIVPLTTGFSNETYRLEGCDLILRLPPSAGAMLDGHDVIGQAKIYAALGQLADAPPVPEIVLTCADESKLGVPFYVMACVAGESVHDTSLQDWFTRPADSFREGLCRQWISAFAALARLAPVDTIGGITTPEDDARMWRRFADNADSPELVELFDRLLAVPAPRSGPPGIVHGDAKLSNLMWHDGQISAMLDWEMALNGEPLADLGYLLYGFESEYHGATTPNRQPGMLKRDEVIALWSKVSGRSAEGLFWHEIAQIGKLSAIIAEGKNMYETGRSQDPKLEYFKKNIGYYIGTMRAMLDGGGF